MIHSDWRHNIIHDPLKTAPGTHTHLTTIFRECKKKKKIKKTKKKKRCASGFYCNWLNDPQYATHKAHMSVPSLDMYQMRINGQMNSAHSVKVKKRNNSNQSDTKKEPILFFCQMFCGWRSNILCPRLFFFFWCIYHYPFLSSF